MLRILTVLLIALLLAACGTSAPSPVSESLTREEALHQLDELQPQGGVDAQTFAQLKDALRRSLLASEATRFTSATPSGAAGAVNDLTLASDGSTLSLEWTYANRADYDQNRQVNIADLSTLGAQLGKGTSSPDWMDKARVADGDLNGLITISDITPIGASLLATVDGYWVQSSTTPSDAGSWSDIEQVPFEDSVLDAGNPFKRFSFVLDNPQPGTFYRVRPYNGEDTGPVSNYVELQDGPPSITDVQPQSGNVGAVVQFSATLDGSPPDDFAWDFGGGAVPNTTIDPSPTVTLGAAGSYSASLTVTGALGSDTYNFTLEVTSAVAPPQIDDVQPQTGLAGTQITLVPTLSGGTPDTYDWNFGGTGAEVVPNTSTDPSPTVDLIAAGNYNASLTVGNAGGTDTFNFVLAVNPPPAPPLAPVNFSATDGDYPDYVHLSWEPDPNGNTPDEYELFRGDSAGGPFTSIASVVTQSYDDFVPTRNQQYWYYVVAKLTNASDSDPSATESGYAYNGLPGAWHYTQVPGVSDDTATYLRVVECNGKPGICRRGINPLWFAQFCKAQDAEGTSWNMPFDISSGSTGDFEDLAVINGKPAVLLNNQWGIPTSEFYSSADPDGLVWSNPVQCWDEPLDGTVRLAEVNDRPAFVFGTGPRYFVEAADSTGDIWPSTASTMHVHAGSGNLITLADGRPATYIDWADGMNYHAEFAVAQDLAGTIWGSVGIINQPLGSDNLYARSVQVSAGTPWTGLLHIAGGTNTLSTLFANDSTGSAWQPMNANPVDGSTDSSDSYFAVLNNRPCVISVNPISPGMYEIVFVEAADSQATGWNPPENFLSGEQFAFPCLCGIGTPQRPAIAFMYSVAGNWALVFAERY